jgi:hypothetical protein
MSSRLEYLLCLIGTQSTTRQPVESPCTAPMRLTRQDALAELSYALQGPSRMEVAAALLRWSPDLLSSGQFEMLRGAVRDAVLLYGLTMRPRLSDAKMPKAVLQATHCAIQEHAEWEPCRTCKGKGKVQEMSKTPGVGLVSVQCPSCNGAGYKGWSTLHRARVMGLPWTTAARSRAEMARYGAALLDGWSATGVDAVRRMGLAKRKTGV